MCNKNIDIKRRVTNDFDKETDNAQSILNISRIEKKSSEKLNLPNGVKINQGELFEIEDTKTISASSETGIMKSTFNKIKKSYYDSRAIKITAEIINSYGSKMLLDYSIGESKFTLQYPISNFSGLRNDKINELIAKDLDEIIRNDNHENS